MTKRTGYLIGGLSTVFVVAIAIQIPGWLRDPAERLLEIPHLVEASLEEREFGDAVEFLAPDFEAHGLNRDQIKLLLADRVGAGYRVHVAHVEGDPLEEDELERDVVVIGLISQGPAEEATLKSLRRFRVVAEARWVEGDWQFTRAKAEID